MLKTFASGMRETREAYLVKRRSFPDSDVPRFTNDEDDSVGAKPYEPPSPDCSMQELT